MAQSNSKKVKWSIGKRIIFGVITIALFFVMGECGLRVAGFAMRPKVANSNNSLSDCNAIVVLTIGDSMTFGLGAKTPSESYPMQLSRFWRKTYPKVPLKVHNLGVPGSNTSEGRMLLHQFFENNPNTIPDFTFILYGLNNRWNLRHATFWDWDQNARKKHLISLAASKLQLGKAFSVAAQGIMEAAVRNRRGYHNIVKREGWSVFFPNFQDDLLVRWIEHDYKNLSEYLVKRDIKPVFLSYFHVPFPGLNPLIRHALHKQNATLLDIERPARFFTAKRMWAEDRFHLNAKGYRRIAKDVVINFKRRFDKSEILSRLQKKRRSNFCANRS